MENESLEDLLFNYVKDYMNPTPDLKFVSSSSSIERCLITFYSLCNDPMPKLAQDNFFPFTGIYRPRKGSWAFYSIRHCHMIDYNNQPIDIVS